MRCTKLQLQDRAKLVAKATIHEWPWRFCQRRLVNPEEENLWANKFDKLYFNENEVFDVTYCNRRNPQGGEDLYLSVQNLQFQGEVHQRKRPRTSFKFKSLPHQQHRMFVKELVEDNWNEGANGCSGRCSELTCYFYDDYAKYLLSNDLSRSSSDKSSIFLFHAVDKSKKSVNTKSKMRPKTLKTAKSDSYKKKPNEILNDNIKDPDKKSGVEDTRVSYHKNGKRKSLTISRVDSPTTLQVIRVDVVCNYSSSSTVSDIEDTKQTKVNEITTEQKAEKRESNVANKYLLTNAVKTLDENAGGARVTLLCKTFKLADRSGLFAENKAQSLRIRRK